VLHPVTFTLLRSGGRE